MKFQVSNWWLLALVIVVYIAGMFVDLMEADAAQYASMSLEMMRTGNYLEIYHRGADYIDKPPLIFWTTALSFKLFGVSNFTYKLPSVLFTLLGLLSVYQFTRMFYGKLPAYVATLVLASCHAWFQINQDVRTDTILAACTMFAIWQLARFEQDRRFSSVVLASLGMAGAMMTKGPIGLMVPALAIATDAALKRNWSTFFRWQWLVAAVIILVLLTPMLIGLWNQFDAVGGKKTYNGFIDSGIKFYFWTQSFGRLTGESTWRNNAGPFFFAHTFLWAFLPWSLLALFGYGRKLWSIIRSGLKLAQGAEAYTIGGTILPVIAFSMSQYKLPHYIFVFFPLVAVVTGAAIADVVAARSPGFKVLRGVQVFIASILVVIAGIFIAYIFPDAGVGVTGLAACGAGGMIYSIFKARTRLRQLLLPSLFAIVTLNLVFNAHIYPRLLKYESGDVAGKLARSLQYPLVGYMGIPYGIDFYYRGSVPVIRSAEELSSRFSGKEVMVYADEAGYQALRQADVTIVQHVTLDHFHVSTVSLKFLLPSRRSSLLTQRHLLVVKP